MTTQLIEALIQSGGAVVVAFGFLFYLVKRDKEYTESLNKLAKLLNHHMQQDIQVQTKLVESVQKLNDKIDRNFAGIKQMER